MVCREFLPGGFNLTQFCYSCRISCPPSLLRWPPHWFRQDKGRCPLVFFTLALQLAAACQPDAHLLETFPRGGGGHPPAYASFLGVRFLVSV